MADTKKKKTILIIDDEDFLVKVLKGRLESEGFFVACASDGQEGLDRAFADRPDLILLDLVMPVMDGIAMLKKLRGDQWGKNVPVIVLSNLNNAKAMDESLAAGAQTFLVKVNTSLDDVVAIAKRKLTDN